MFKKGSDGYMAALGLVLASELIERVRRERGVAHMTEADAVEIRAAFGLAMGEPPPEDSEAGANCKRVLAEVEAEAKAAAKATG